MAGKRERFIRKFPCVDLVSPISLIGERSYEQYPDKQA
jgi:hypothetical protein